MPDTTHDFVVDVDTTLVNTSNATQTNTEVDKTQQPPVVPPTAQSTETNTEIKNETKVTNEQTPTDTSTETNQDDNSEKSPLEYHVELDNKYSGIEYSEEELQELSEFDTNTEEGYVNFLQKRDEILVNKQVENIFNNLPEDVLEYIKYRSSGGDKEKFFTIQNTNSYTDIKIDPNDISQQKNIVIKHNMEVYGMSEDRAKKIANLFEADGSLLDEASKYQLEGKEFKEALSKQELAKQQEIYQQELERKKIYQQEVESKVNNGKLVINNEEYVIPKDNRERLTYEMFNLFVDDEGYFRNSELKRTKNEKEALTISDVRLKAMPLDSRLLQLYQVTFGLDSLVKQTIQQKKVEHIKKLVNNRFPNNQGIQKSTNKTSADNVDLSNVDIQFIS